MERKMYVLQNEDGKFYWKNENTSSSHCLVEGFENAFLFKTKNLAVVTPDFFYLYVNETKLTLRPRLRPLRRLRPYLFLIYGNCSG